MFVPVLKKNRLIAIVALLHSLFPEEKKKKKETCFDKSGILNTQKGDSLPIEMLDWNNFLSWEYNMHQYNLDKGYWSYIKGV